MAVKKESKDLSEDKKVSRETYPPPTELSESFSQILENPFFGIGWFSPQGNLLHANETFCGIFSFSLREIPGMKLSDFSYPEEDEKERHLLNKLLQGEIQSYRIEKRCFTKKKKVIWVEFNLQTCKNHGGEIKFFAAMVQDITSRKAKDLALQNSLNNLRIVFNSIDSACILLDCNLNILAFNPLSDKRALLYFGKSLGEGKNLASYFHTERHGHLKTMMQKALGGTDISYERPAARKEEHGMWHSVSIKCVKNSKGDVVGLCLLLTDISGQKNSEIEIKSAFNVLLQKIERRTSELEESNRELEAFTYSVSHDLSSPLHVVEGFADVLLENSWDKLDEEGKDNLKVIKKNLSRMAQLISDLLDLSRLGRRTLVKKQTDMNHLVSGVIDELKFVDFNFIAEVNLGALPDAFCDPTTLKQVWINLISNAVKYSCNQPYPVIEIGAQENDKEFIYYVKDNGAGFDMSESEKLFTAFHRTSAVAEIEGTGIGLAIVYRIILRHEGRVWAEGKINEGATFYFSLPVKGN